MGIIISFFLLTFGGFLTPAWAIDFNAIMMDEADQPILDCPNDAQGCVPGTEAWAKARKVTLGMIVSKALFASYPDEQQLPADEKWNRAALAMRVRDGKDVKLTVEEIALIKKLVGKAYSPLLVYRAFTLLDPGQK